ncbi:hypothetical protein GQ53DRAFT_744236 [Thozetella sp. PMI_491]|nr:hypothetical protein GQ53DRAFT_744236 [Thozetella sp. PMI_491]
MDDAPRSPKRRRILSSINPLGKDGEEGEARSRPRSASPHRRTRSQSPASEEGGDDSRRKHRSSKFRFKSHHRSSRSRKHSSSHQSVWETEEKASRTPHKRGRRHHKQRHRSPTPPPQDEAKDPDPFSEPVLDPEAAFRESLFDAMADDEGAAYWEGVYGQPIHTWAAERDRVGPDGELDRMTDDEYAAYVRQKMWEKTHPGIMEERERRAREAAERERKAEESRRIQKEMERSLRRGDQRRRKKAARADWDEYEAAWKRWDGTVGEIPWPLRSDHAREVEADTVRAFFVNGIDLEELGEKGFAARLKEERVRWHPDKMQQKLGGKVDAAVMRDITAIFQTIDKLWDDTRAKA